MLILLSSITVFESMMYGFDPVPLKCSDSSRSKLTIAHIRPLALALRRMNNTIDKINFNDCGSIPPNSGVTDDMDNS